MALAHADTNCQVGIIVGNLRKFSVQTFWKPCSFLIGTGSNACYLEKIDRCPKLDDLEDREPDEVNLTQTFQSKNAYFIPPYR